MQVHMNFDCVVGQSPNIHQASGPVCLCHCSQLLSGADSSGSVEYFGVWAMCSKEGAITLMLDKARFSKAGGKEDVVKKPSAVEKARVKLRAMGK